MTVRLVLYSSTLNEGIVDACYPSARSKRCFLSRQSDKTASSIRKNAALWLGVLYVAEFVEDEVFHARPGVLMNSARSIQGFSVRSRKTEKASRKSRNRCK